MAGGLRHFIELDAVLKCAQLAANLGRVKEEAFVKHGIHDFPILSFEFGVEDEPCPTLVFVGGVHGLERVGTHVVTAYLQSFLRLLKWDETTKNIMKHCRLVFYPLANPVGMFRGTRANGRGVDIMRNSRVDANHLKLPLVGGHRISPRIPWFRGWKDTPELETKVLMKLINNQLERSSLLLSLDVHSGFGASDRLWFPFASTTDVFPESHRLLKLKKNLDMTYPNHIYIMEPQSLHYTTHGDLWDELYMDSQKKEQCTFIPLCLEMGSWAWIRKNPRQMLSFSGMFNPILPHRLKRAQRRHLPFFDFLLKSLYSADHWAFMDEAKSQHYREKAKMLWYQNQ